jgi:hypothetical protein
MTLYHNGGNEWINAPFIVLVLTMAMLFVFQDVLHAENRHHRNNP